MIIIFLISGHLPILHYPHNKGLNVFANIYTFRCHFFRKHKPILKRFNTLQTDLIKIFRFVSNIMCLKSYKIRAGRQHMPLIIIPHLHEGGMTLSGLFYYLGDQFPTEYHNSRKNVTSSGKNYSILGSITKFLQLAFKLELMSNYMRLSAI